jgi:cell division protein FtsW
MSTTPLTAVRAPVKDRTRNTLQRERHEPEYGILVATVALAAIGILMVYSSSAIKAYLSKENDPFAIVGPQIQWAVLGLIAMLVMMRIDYRRLRLVALPMFVAGIVGLLLVFVPAINIVIGGSARWVQIGPLPAVHPAEFMKLALVVYLAYSLEKRGTAVKGLWSGTIPFLVLAAPVVVLVLLEPDLGTASVLAFTAFTMFFLAGANLVHLAGMAVLAVPAVFVYLRGYQMARITSWLDPWADKAGDGFHSVQGFYALALGGIFGAGLGESRLAGGLYLPNAFNDFIFAIVGEEFGLVGAGLVILLFLAMGYLGIRTALGAPDTFGALLAAGITSWICLQAFINIAVVVGLIPVTGIPLPFVSAGGSSLIISFAAVGILLSISRETVEKGTWNDAPADRGRGNGRSHLPGPRRRTVAPRPDRRA